MAEPIFHITTAGEWRDAQAAGRYTAPSLETEGFIHTSTAIQVPATAARFYADVDDLVLLRIDPDQLSASLRWEEAHADEYFPHIYGPLDIDAVLAVEPFEPGTDGVFPMPTESGPA